MTDLKDQPFTSVVVLGAVVSFQDHFPQVTRVSLNYTALKQSSRPFGIALRIKPYTGPFASESRTTKLLADIISDLLQSAQNAGLKPSEFQIDFDCAESKLNGYCTWIESIKKELPGIPVTVTVLPCWLKHSYWFSKLARAADGFVLQVHSFEKPAVTGELTLCKPEAAKAFVDQAARFGRPFRIALPTYGHIAVFNSRGKLLALQSEGFTADIRPQNTTIRRVYSDPAAMAALVRSWTKRRPETMQGIIWYRLPVSTDRLNWKLTTLKTVMKGIAPEAHLSAETVKSDPCLFDIVLENKGHADAAIDVSVSVTWNDARLVASDSLDGFRCSQNKPNELVLSYPETTPFPLLGPGERKTVGWIRLSNNQKVEAHVTP